MLSLLINVYIDFLLSKNSYIDHKVLADFCLILVPPAAKLFKVIVYSYCP